MRWARLERKGVRLWLYMTGRFEKGAYISFLKGLGVDGVPF